MVGMSKPKNLHIAGILTATILLIFNTGNAQVPTNQQVLANLIVQPVLAATVGGRVNWRSADVQEETAAGHSSCVQISER